MLNILLYSTFLSFLIKTVSPLKGQNYINENNIILYITCDYSISDESINRYTILNKLVTLTNDRNNNNRKACQFKATDKKYLQVHMKESLLFPFVLSFWFLNPTFDIPQTFFTFYETNTSSRFDILLHKDKVLITINESEIVIEYDSFTIEEEKWTFASIVFRPSGISLFINGDLVTRSHQIFSFPKITSISIGAAPNDTIHFTGDLDEISLYDMSSDPNEFTSDNATQFYNYYRCDPGIEVYDSNANECKTCSVIFKHCSICYNVTMCHTCSYGFTFQENECVCQEVHCKECNDDGECLSCKEGYSFDELNNCIANECNEILYCIRCNEGKCIQCAEGFSIKDGKCKKPVKAILGVSLTYLGIIVIIWLVIIFIIRPKLI